jgi:hypothetical protein
MDWKTWLDVFTSVISVIALLVSIYAIIDNKAIASRAVFLARDQAFTKIRNNMVWEYIDPTPDAHRMDIANDSEQFGAMAKAAEPGKWTDAIIKEVIDSTSLHYASALVAAGLGKWKPKFSMEAIDKKLHEWQTSQNRERINTLLGRKNESLF